MHKKVVHAYVHRRPYNQLSSISGHKKAINSTVTEILQCVYVSEASRKTMMRHRKMAITLTYGNGN